MTLATTAGDIYRALIEATAFSTRRILDAFEKERIPVTELIAVGGLAERSPLLLQIYADVTRRPIGLADAVNASALGAAMLGAVAAGPAGGGHASFADAARAMAHLKPERVAPDPARRTRTTPSIETGSSSTTTSDRRTDLMKRLRRGARLTTPLVEGRGISMEFPGVGRSTVWTSTCCREKSTP